MSLQRYGIWYSFLLILLVGVDQYSKYLILKTFSFGEGVSVIPSFFNLVYVRNYGAVFGFLNDPNMQWQFWFFMAVGIFSFVFLGYMMWDYRDNGLAIIACSCILAGAIGNTIDRVRYRFVVDFLDFYIKSYHWPAFNFADIFIVVGVSVMFIVSFFPKNGISR
ncbi:MAG: signal peptidase II [Desulfovibrionaceae bacterium]